MMRYKININSNKTLSIVVLSLIFIIIPQTAGSWNFHTGNLSISSSYNIVSSLLKPPEYLPIIYQPEEDPNELIAVYYYEHPNTSLTEITLVFSGETHPNWFIDKTYILFRILKYHRIADIETFYIKTNELGEPEEINFSYNGVGTYSGNQTYNTFFPKHYIKRVSYSKFENSENRAHIYVNTWNHLFSEKKNNKETHDIWSDYPIILGTREKAEADFKMKLQIRRAFQNSFL